METLAGIIDSHNGDLSDMSKIGPLISKVVLSEEEIAGACMLITMHPEWDGAAIGKVLNASFPRGVFAWDMVMPLLEKPISSLRMTIKSPQSLANVMQFIYNYDPQNIKEIGEMLFTRKWTDLQYQIDILANASVPIFSSLVDTSLLGLTKVIDADLFSNAPPHIKSMIPNFIAQPLNYRELIHSSLDAVIREEPNASVAKGFLDSQAKMVPEIFILGSVTIPKPWTMLLERINKNFFELFFSGQATSSLVFYGLSKVAKEFLFESMIDSCERDLTAAPRALLVCQENNLFDEAISLNNFNFTIDLAAAADRKGIYSFENFLRTSHQKYGNDFLIALLDFLGSRATVEYSQNQPGGIQGGFNLRSVAAALSFIASADLPQDRVEQLKSIQIQCLQAFPRLINFGQGHDAAIIAHTNSFSPDVEREMKLYYQQMYERQIEIRDIITMLQRLKQSDDSHDQDVFACMVHSLFDEYRFFPEYPLNALAATAVLFGSLIHYKLIEGMPLSIALRFVLDSVKQPPDSNMFKFGLQALFEFRERLNEFPKYCSLLLNIPGLQSQQQFYQQIKDAVADNDVDSSSNQVPPSFGITDDQTNDTSQPVFSAISADVIIGDDLAQEEPNESISDKILFSINNIAQNNVVAKSKEMTAILDPKYFNWFASHIVGLRSKQEPNYHSLYISMLQSIGNMTLENCCIKVTYTNIIQLLNSPDTVNSSEKRNQLKNLGQWLGSLLLGRNKPILHKNIAFKKLLVEGYDLDRLPVVLPFVCKILERSSLSTVFLPPNPWLMGIIQVLAELYKFADLKLNLKFEIEVLCNQLKLDIEEIEVSTIIRNHPNQDEIANQNLALEMEKLRLQQGAGDVIDTRPQLSEAIDARASEVATDTSPYFSLVSHLVLKGNSAYVTHTGLKRIFQLAIDKSIREILQPVVDRSVTIATIATRELITKDFALEPDEQKMRIAAQNLVRVLAGNISLATCKDPLRESLAAHLRALMVANGYGEDAALMEQILIAVNDNVDSVYAIVEKAAIEKSYPEIEEALMPGILSRKRHRESHSPQPFMDLQLTSRYALQLPDPFRLTPGGLSAQQFSIYEGFGKYGPEDYSVEVPTGVDVLSNNEAVVPSDTTATGGYDLDAVNRQRQNSQGLLEQTILQMQHGIETLNKLVAEAKETSFKQLAPNHPIRVLLERMLVLAVDSALREQVILKTSQITVSALFTASETQLAREVLCTLLEKLCSISSPTAKEVILWLIYSDDERKYNVPVIITLIKSNLITVSEIDSSLAEQISAKVVSAIVFAAGLIYETVLGDEPCALRTDFTGCLEAMEILAKEDPPNQIAQKLLQSLDTASAVTFDKQQSPLTLKEQLTYIFAEWTRLWQHSAKSERMCHLFVYQLSQYGILSDLDDLCALIRVSLKIATKSYNLLSSESSDMSHAFAAVDALAGLIALVIRSTEEMDLKSRIEYSRNIFSVIALVFAAEHEDEWENFNERAYFRLFSTMLFEFEVASDNEDSTFLSQLYILMANIFKTLQPLAFPGFSFSWVSLISHRYFLPRLLELRDKIGWSHMCDLLKQLVEFQGTYVEDKNFPEPIAVMYRGTLRIFLIMLHDYPEFLIENHYKLCNVFPLSFVQLRNLVLSAFPRNMELPDPLTQGLKVDRLPEIRESPKVAFDPAEDLTRLGLLKLVDSYLKSPSSAVIKGIMSGMVLKKPKNQTGVGFKTVRIDQIAVNALVLYVGIQATATDKSKPESETAIVFNRESAHLALLTQLMAESNTEGRYFLCEAIANQLRYPNRHTHFFSCVTLSIFGSHGSTSFNEKKQDVQHLLTRVLLERIICNRPHPVSTSLFDAKELC